MWQCQAQTPGSVGVHEHGVALARGDVDGVGLVRLGQREAVLGDHELRHAVQVHRVGLTPSLR